MRRIVAAVMGTISGLALLLSYHTSTNTGSSSPPDPGLAAGDEPAPGPASGEDPAGGDSGTYTGDAVDTRWGVVQVQITVEDGEITAARAVRYPQGNQRDVEINDYALPQLEQAVLQAQSGSIDSVSGATVTSEGYARSVQSAIDQAHLS